MFCHVSCLVCFSDCLNFLLSLLHYYLHRLPTYCKNFILFFLKKNIYGSTVHMIYRLKFTGYFYIMSIWRIYYILVSRYCMKLKGWSNKVEFLIRLFGDFGGEGEGGVCFQRTQLVRYSLMNPTLA